VNVKVLALDLEGTLVDDARSARARPGLRAFLAFCHEQFARVAVFTGVETTAAREVLERLAHTGHVPAELLDGIEYIEWSGEYKDLEFVSDAAPGDVLLVDDDAGWVRPDQRAQWIAVAGWDGRGPDFELARVRTVLERRLAGGVQYA
jgi:hypothetical protein